MAKSPKKGIFASLGDAIFEPEGGAAPARSPAPTSGGIPPAPGYIPPAASYIPQPNQPYQAQPYSAAPAPAYPSATYQPQVPAEPDPKALGRAQSIVYADIEGRASRFLHFTQMYDTLGRPADVRVAINALQITDKSLTTEGIVADARAHLGMLEGFVQQTESEFAQETANRIGTKDAEAQSLIDANTAATAEIDRHQKETAERTTKLTQLATTRAEEEAKLTCARQRVDHATSYLRQSLNSAISLLGGAAAPVA